MFSRAAVDRQVTLLTFLALLARGATSGPLASATDLPRNTPVIYTAIVNVTYRDPATGEQRYEYNDGWFSSENRIGPSWGWLQVARSANNRTDGCDPIVNRADGWWVALVERGRCRFHQKIENAAVFNNASAVIIYNNEHDAQVLNMQHGVEDVVAIFLRRNDGLRLLKLMENSTRVFVTITPGSTYFPSMDAPSRTSVIFLFISFIVLAVVSLLWLIFYYVQRFRVHGSLGVERARKNKMAKQLNRAAKLVVSKMEQKVLKPDDPELLSEELQICAVCVEEYKANDKIRILPCKHTFHKKCVDQWLHDKRRCPICQLDILKTAGIQIPDEYQTLNSSNNPAAAPGNNNNDSIEDDNYGAVNSPATSGNHSPLDDTILVSVVPGCSAHLYLTYVEDRSGEAGAVTPGDGQRPRGHMADNVSDTTYHSNESLLDTFDGKDVIAISLDEEGIVGPEFKSRLSSDSLSLPSGMTASSSSSSSSSTFDIREKGKGRPDDKSNNNNVSTTSINSRLTAVASPAIDDDDNNNNSNNNGDDDDDDDSPSSSFSPSRYYDCHGEAPVHKSQMV